MITKNDISNVIKLTLNKDKKEIKKYLSNPSLIKSKNLRDSFIKIKQSTINPIKKINKINFIYTQNRNPFDIQLDKSIPPYQNEKLYKEYPGYNYLKKYDDFDNKTFVRDQQGGLFSVISNAVDEIEKEDGNVSNNEIPQQQHNTIQPHTGQPVAGPPYTGQPVVAQPHTGQPVAGPPYTGQPVAAQPHTGQPVAGHHTGNVQNVSENKVKFKNDINNDFAKDFNKLTHKISYNSELPYNKHLQIDNLQDRYLDLESHINNKAKNIENTVNEKLSGQNQIDIMEEIKFRLINEMRDQISSKIDSYIVQNLNSQMPNKRNLPQPSVFQNTVPPFFTPDIVLP